MLNEIQKLTIRALVKKGADKDAEIKKLAAGFVGTSEPEIRKYWEDFSGSSSASAEPKHQKAASAPATGNSRGKRLWTEEMLQQLVDLREHGETAAHIAEMMGLDVKQVKNKLDRLPDRVKVQAQHSKKGEPEKAEEKALQMSAAEDREVVIPLSPASEAPVPLPDPFRQVKQAICEAFSPFAGTPNADEPDEEIEISACPIDMPEALYRIAQMVRDDFCGEVTGVHASKSERKATCTFDYDGVAYELKLEVLK